MKPFIIISIAISSTLSCGHAGKKTIPEKIEAHLLKTMHDPDSYEPIGYDTLVPIFTSYADTEAGQKIKQRRDELGAKIKEIGEDVEIIKITNPKKAVDMLQEGMVFAKEAAALSQQLSDSISANDMTFQGYSVLHSFRGKNQYGAKVVSVQKFILDSSFNVVRSEKTDEPK